MMKTIVFLILILPGLVAAYALLLRPILSRIPTLQKFYANADGFWGGVWAWCGNSLTILWGKVLGGIGLGLTLLDPIAALVGDPDFKAQVANLTVSPKVAGAIAIAISVITIAARLRSIVKG